MALINQNNKMTYSPVGFAPTTFTKEEWQTKIMQAEDVLLNIEGHCNGPDEADIAGIGTLKHYFVKDAYEGKVITLSHIKSIKPGCRVVLKFDGNLFGKMVKQDIKQSMLTNWSLMHV